MAECRPSSRNRTIEIQAGPRFYFDSSFDTTALIALYRIAEREVYRAPTDEFWLSRLAYVQAALNDARRHDVFPILSKDSQRAVGLFVSVLEMEGAYLPVAEDRHRLLLFITVAILTPTPGEDEIRRMAEFVQNEGPGLAAYPVLPTHPDPE